MYLKWNEKTTSDFSDASIESLYGDGFVFTRIGKGKMQQTRSLRIDLAEFALSSENRRIQKKMNGLFLRAFPIPYSGYEWSIHKMGKDFYEKKFGEKTFGAQKIKQLITDGEKSNFNLLLEYELGGKTAGYCICLETKHILHYCYPFYNLENAGSNLGMGMMLEAILWAGEAGKKYIYLGSAQRPADKYKLQFAGLEWFDGSGWRRDTGELKKILKEK